MLKFVLTEEELDDSNKMSLYSFFFFKRWVRYCLTIAVTVTVVHPFCKKSKKKYQSQRVVLPRSAWPRSFHHKVDRRASFVVEITKVQGPTSHFFFFFVKELWKAWFFHSRISIHFSGTIFVSLEIHDCINSNARWQSYIFGKMKGKKSLQVTCS